MRKVIIFILMITLLISSITFVSAKGCILISQNDINNGPYIIVTPGNYCLKEDLHINYDWKNRYGTKLINIKTRDVSIDLLGHSIINDDGSSYMRSNFNKELRAIDARGRQNGIPFVGSNLSIKNGKIIGFDFGINDIALRKTKKLIIENVYFDNVYQAIWARPITATINNNFFINTKSFLSSVVGISLQGTDYSMVNNNVFVNHHTTIDLSNAKTMDINFNSIKSPDVKFPVFPRGITITNVKDANIYKNNLKDLYIGVLANLQSSVSVIKNNGCRLTYQIYINQQARVGEVGNNWNSC